MHLIFGDLDFYSLYLPLNAKLLQIFHKTMIRSSIAFRLIICFDFWLANLRKSAMVPRGDNAADRSPTLATGCTPLDTDDKLSAPQRGATFRRVVGPIFGIVLCI